MSYAKAIQKLESVSEGKRALLREVYFNGKDCCAVGLLCPAARGWWDDTTSAYDLFDHRQVGAEAEALGLTRLELVKIQEVNDFFFGSEEGRFEHVLQRLRELDDEERTHE